MSWQFFFEYVLVFILGVVAIIDEGVLLGRNDDMTVLVTVVRLDVCDILLFLELPLIHPHIAPGAVAQGASSLFEFGIRADFLEKYLFIHLLRIIASVQYLSNVTIKDLELGDLTRWS